MAERAAQFSPFAALAGYDEAVRETGRVVGRRIELSEDEKAELDQKQQIFLVALELGKQPTVTVTYFQPDLNKKNGGEYISYTGMLKGIKEAESCLVFADGMEVHLPDVVDLRSNLFEGCFDVL